MSTTATSITLQGSVGSSHRSRNRWMAAALLAAVAATTAVMVATRAASPGRSAPVPVAQTRPVPPDQTVTGTGPDLEAVAWEGSVQYGPVTGTGPDLVAVAQAPVYASAPVTGTGPDLTVVGTWSAGAASDPATTAPPAQEHARQIER